jgi:hypothetical protein
MKTLRRTPRSDFSQASAISVLSYSRAVGNRATQAPFNVGEGSNLSAGFPSLQQPSSTKPLYQSTTIMVYLVDPSRTCAQIIVELSRRI